MLFRSAEEETSLTTTEAPPAASASASARPSPAPAPVTIATLLTLHRLESVLAIGKCRLFGYEQGIPWAASDRLRNTFYFLIGHIGPTDPQLVVV